MDETVWVPMPALLAWTVTSIMLLAAPAVAARPVDAPIGAPAIARAEYGAAIAAASKAYRNSVRAAESAYKEALRLAGTKEAMKLAQARALAVHAHATQQAKDRHAPVIASAQTRGDRKLASAALERELQEIDRALAASLNVARKLLDPKFAREQAGIVRARSLSDAQAVLDEAKRIALLRLNEVLIRHGLPPVVG